MLWKVTFNLTLIFLGAFITAHAALSQSKEGRQHRIVPLRPLSQDFEVIYGDPEVVGEPFVMRIRELPGTIIPPHKHPVDEHITVVQGTLYFAVGEKFDRSVMKEMKAGSYAFIPKGSTMFGYIPDGAIVRRCYLRYQQQHLQRYRASTTNRTLIIHPRVGPANSFSRGSRGHN